MDAKLAEARAGRLPWFADAEHRRSFMRLYARMLAARRVAHEMVEQVIANPHLGGSPLPSYVKLIYSEVLQEYADFLLQREGLAAQTWRPKVVGGDKITANSFNDFLSSYAWTISGGANEVLKNIVAERALGLPR